MTRRRLHALTTHLAAALLLCVAGAQAGAADWQKVLSDRYRTVEIDRASIFASDAGTKVSWGRIVMAEAGAAAVGYRTIKALNRYDCLNRSFFTIKRVYLDASDRVIREETNADQAPVMVTRDTADERMWREVCRPVGSADLGKIAEAAGKAAAAAKTALQRQAPEPRPASPALPTPPLTALEPLPPASTVEPAATAAATQRRTEPASAAPAPAAAPPPARPATVPTPAVEADPAPPVVTARPAPVPRLDPASRAQTPAASPRPAAPSAPVRPPRSESWSYAGNTGPDRWGRLHPEWKLCAQGERQSPIDLRDGIAVELDPVKFDYPETAFRITDTGNMLRVDVAEVLFMDVRGERYRLEYFTLHRPSQERVGGGASAMAVHLHHRASNGKAAILGVLVDLGDEANPLLQVLLNNLPLERRSSHAPAATIDLGAFLPASHGHFLYMGSMTTPPCTEDVLWVVMKEAVVLSDDQLALFSRLYPRNSRPIQAHKGRRVLESR